MKSDLSTVWYEMSISANIIITFYILFIFYNSGAIFEGLWKKNKKTGHGRFILKDCGAFQCHFKDDNVVSGVIGHFMSDIG